MKPNENPYMKAFAGALFNQIILLFKLLIQDPVPKVEGFGDESEILSTYNTGPVIGGNARLPRSLAHQNILLLGPTGTGKGIYFFHNILTSATPGNVYVVMDPSGELYSKHSHHLSKKFKLNVIKFDDPYTDGFNLLKAIETPADINKLASILISTALPSKGGDPFWNLSAVSILRLCITILLTQDERYHNMANLKYVVNTLSSNPEKIDRVFAKNADEVLMSEYKAFLSYDTKVQQGVLATVTAALQIFSDPQVARATSVDTIDWSNLRKKSRVIFIQNHSTDSAYYSVLVSLLFYNIVNRLMRTLPSKQDNDVYFLLDEASSLVGLEDSLPLILANNRKYCLSFFLAYQSDAQLNAMFGNNSQTVRDNCLTRIYLSSQGLKTATELEQVLKSSYIDERGNHRIKPLLDSSAIRTMPSNRAIVICSNKKPFYIKLTAYFERFWADFKTRLPSVQRTQRKIPDHIQLLDL